MPLLSQRRSIYYFVADWLCDAELLWLVWLGERPATFSAEGSKRRKRRGLLTPSLSLHRGQSPEAAATVALKLLSHRSQKNTGNPLLVGETVRVVERA
jgi:hypothetical protein